MDYLSTINSYKTRKKRELFITAVERIIDQANGFGTFSFKILKKNMLG